VIFTLMCNIYTSSSDHQVTRTIPESFNEILVELCSTEIRIEVRFESPSRRLFTRAIELRALIVLQSQSVQSALLRNEKLRLFKERRKDY
jgi:hypothetical protein